MPYSTARRPVRRSSGGERVFSDDEGRLWSASHTRGPDGAALVFACISDSRQPVRAIALEPNARVSEASDDTLRAWLRDAPRIGRLM